MSYYPNKLNKLGLTKDTDDIKSQRYPVVQEIGEKNNLNNFTLNSPTNRKRIQSKSNSIQYKSHNNLETLDRIGQVK